MTRITPCLWFDDDVESALELYTSLFDDARVVSSTPAPPGSPFRSGLMTAVVELAGHRLMLLNGSGGRPFTEAVSLMVEVGIQSEIDRLWDGLVANGGAESRCGWLIDRFGVSWQIVPTALPRLLGDPDAERSQRAMSAMLGMTRIVIADLEAAAAG